ncbi:MAG TPA: hypothetical protein VFA59_05815 [Vicinamibacterales bacterium]|nr:hypothetical protein [Vicinamibacterales bacterium]
MTQTSGAVTGSVRVVDPADLYYAGGVDGTISGTITNGVLICTMSFATLRVPGCTETDAGQLTIATATTMSGTNIETNSCRPSVTSTITFLKQ